MMLRDVFGRTEEASFCGGMLPKGEKAAEDAKRVRRARTLILMTSWDGSDLIGERCTSKGPVRTSSRA